MAIVCVTGASGYFASWLVKRLLEAGYHVRGTVRDPDDPRKTAHLWALDGAKERLQLFKADVSNEGVFDSIIEGCEGVFHTATPTSLTAKDPEKEIVEAAVLGTLNVLKACKKASTVRRVVLTSSTATLRFSPKVNANTVVDESYWTSLDFCRARKRHYDLSKTLAEQSAWEYAKSNGIDLVTVIPSFIFGSFLPPQPATSAGMLLNLLNGDSSHFSQLKYIGWVHQDDVATAHILAYENPNANGRYLCTGVDLTNNEVAEFISKRYPEFNIPTNFGYARKGYKNYNCTKLESLGLKFKGLDEMLDDTIKTFKQKGLLRTATRSKL